MICICKCKDLEKRFEDDSLAGFMEELAQFVCKGSCLIQHNENFYSCKVLQRMDKNFHVFIGQVGYWLPGTSDYMRDKNTVIRI